MSLVDVLEVRVCGNLACPLCGLRNDSMFLALSKANDISVLRFCRSLLTAEVACGSYIDRGEVKFAQN